MVTFVKGFVKVIYDLDEPLDECQGVRTYKGSCMFVKVIDDLDKPLTQFSMSRHIFSFNDLDWLLTGISRSRYFSTFNISETTRDRAIITIEHQ